MTEFEAIEKLILLGGVLFLMIVQGSMVGLAFGRVVAHQYLYLHARRLHGKEIATSYLNYLKGKPRG